MSKNKMLACMAEESAATLCAVASLIVGGHELAEAQARRTTSPKPGDFITDPDDIAGTRRWIIAIANWLIKTLEK